MHKSFVANAFKLMGGLFFVLSGMQMQQALAVNVVPDSITNPNPQTLTFAAVPAKTFGNAPFTVSATSTSNLPMTSYTSQTPSACSVSGATVTILTAGTCEVQAYQAGGGIWLPGSKSIIIPIAQAAQTVTIAAIPGKTFGNGAFFVSATSTSGLAVTSFSATPTTVCQISGQTVSLVGAGTCTIGASQGGNTNYLASLTATLQFAVAKASQTITFPAVVPNTYGNAAFAISATSTSNSVVTFTSTTTSVCTVSGTTVTMASYGICTITASQLGTTNYLAAPTVTNNITIYQPPSIAWSTPVNGSSYPSNGTIPISVTVGGGSFAVTSVSYYDGATLLSTVPNSPWSYTASGLSVGSHTFKAVVTNSNGSTANASVNVTILQAPTINIASPADGATVAPSTGITFTPTVSGNGYSVTGVSYYTSTGTLLCSQTASPWSCLDSAGLVAGSYSVNAVVSGTATGSTATATSAPITLTVGTGTGAPITNSTPVANPIAAPSLGNAPAGSLPGSLGVSASGAATYSMPLAIPPGVAGLAPSLVLNYSSQGSNGMLGMGWSLGGLSQIHRCNKTIAQDGVTSGVSFSNTDRLCLDGQRLILLTSPTATGNADSDYWAVGATYSTEVANFSRITSYNGTHGLAFKVESKAGRVLYYGDQGDGTSFITAQGKSGIALLWALGQVQDLSGNYYTISYSNNTTTGEYLPTQINYGGNLTTGLAPHLSVVFNYITTRTDNTIRYVAGSHNDMVSLLSNIQAYTGLFSSGTATKVREYDINYAPPSTSSGRSLIGSVQMQALNPQSNTMVAFPATTFNWGQNLAGHAFTQSAGPVSGPVAPPPVPEVLSVNGNPYNPLLNGAQFDQIVWADFNGDGRLDALVADLSKSPTQFNIYLALPGGGFSAPINWTIPGWVFSDISNRITDMRGAGITNLGIPTWGVVGDFDGDGSTDIFLFGSFVCLSQLKNNPSASNAFVCTDTYSSTNPTGVGSSYNPADYLVMDTTGSGHMDLLMRGGVGGDGSRCVSNLSAPTFTFNCHLYPGTAYAAFGNVNTNSGAPLLTKYQSNVTNFIGDFNGDGLQDLLRGEVPASGGAYFTEVCTSSFDNTGFTCTNWMPGYTSAASFTTGGNNGVTDYPPFLRGISMLADVNGDGLTDMLYSGSDANGGGGTYPYICYSTGVGFDCHNLVTTLPTDAAIEHVGAIDSDGAIKTLAFEYDSTGKAGTWRTCFFQNNSALNCQTIAGGPNVAPINLSPQPGTVWLPDPVSMFGGFLNDGTFNLASYDESVDNVGGTVTGGENYPVNGVSLGAAWKIYTLAPNATLAVDKLVSVTNGIGRLSSVTYTQGGQPSVYTQYPSTGFPTYPQQSVANPGYLVSAFYDSNGQGESIESTYIYTGELTDASGRGSLGFSASVFTNLQNGLSTATSYRQDWPYTGLASASATIATLNGSQKISSTANNYTVLSPSINDPYYTNNPSLVGGMETGTCIICFPYLQMGITEKWELIGGQDLGTVTTTTGYDQFGNQSSNMIQSRLAADPANTYFTTSTTNTWDNDTGTCVASHGATYVIGKLCTATVTKANESGAPITHTASNTYFSTGLLQTEILEPTHTTLPSDNLQVSNTYTRDGYGNVLTKNQSWFDPMSATTLNRATSMTYTSDGRFPATSTNAMDQYTGGQTESYAYDSATGVKTELVDSNKLYYQWLVDGLGRVVSQSTPDGNITTWNYNQCAGDCPSNSTMVTIKTFSNFNTANQNGVPELSYANPLGQIIRTMSYGFNGSPIVTDHTFDFLARC